jgi:hypothetical protein
MTLDGIVKASELIDKLRIVKMGEMFVVQYNLLGYWHYEDSYESFTDAENTIKYLKDSIQKQDYPEVLQEYDLGSKGDNK